jgi:hypothetical protein
MIPGDRLDKAFVMPSVHIDNIDSGEATRLPLDAQNQEIDVTTANWRE